jgi:dipeptidyl aminopeptidase/acylaminoacyl peptidase
VKTIVSLILVLSSAPAFAEPPPLADFFRHAEFSSMVISPGGEYLAVTVPEADRTGVAVLDIRGFPDIKLMSKFSPDRQEHLGGLFWASEERLLLTSSRREGALASPQPTGKIYATNADGSKRRLLYDPFGSGMMVLRVLDIIHRLPNDKDHVLVTERTHDREKPVAKRLNIHTSSRPRMVASSPLSRGELGTDAAGNVVFAAGTNDNFEAEFAWRESPEADWQFFDNPFEGNIAFAGFSADRQFIYVTSRDSANMGLYRVPIGGGEPQPVLQDDRYEVLDIIHDQSGENIIGALFNAPRTELRFIDSDEPTSRLIRSLMNAVPDYNMLVTSYSDDRKKAVIYLYSDREPGVYMLLDAESMALNELVSVRQWVRAEQMSEMRPIEFTTRDGVKLVAYLTVPNGRSAENLPMVVEVHGGPHGPFDSWQWQGWVQAIASRGYAVLQINFRGSGGYGQQFEESGYTHWGDRMQDDLTDGVRWAIDQGIADPERICISGASYGGYAAMMSAIREPDLYRCAFAFAGVYDLELAKKEGNIAQRLGFGEAYLDTALGTDPQRIREHSPVHQVDRIKAELFIAHGAADEQAHYNQFHALVAALEQAGIPHDRLFVSGEGHGFYALENNVELYSRALQLFDRTIGAGRQTAGRVEP